MDEFTKAMRWEWANCSFWLDYIMLIITLPFFFIGFIFCKYVLREK